MSKTAEEILRDLIEKHLEFKSGLETTSIQYYAEYGKVSGSMYLNVRRLCEEYASQQLAEKDKEIERYAIEFAEWFIKNTGKYTDDILALRQGKYIELYKQSLNK